MFLTYLAIYYPISKITSDHKCRANFYPSYCAFQELSLGRTIGSARKYVGLYFFEDNSSRLNQRTYFNFVYVLEDSEIMI